MHFKEYDQAVWYAVLNDIKNYHVVGENKRGWIILKGNKPVKIDKTKLNQPCLN